MVPRNPRLLLPPRFHQGPPSKCIRMQRIGMTGTAKENSSDCKGVQPAEHRSQRNRLEVPGRPKAVCVCCPVASIKKGRTARNTEPSSGSILFVMDIRNSICDAPGATGSQPSQPNVHLRLHVLGNLPQRQHERGNAPNKIATFQRHLCNSSPN